MSDPEIRPAPEIDWGERQIDSHYGFAKTYLHVDHKGRIFAVSTMDGKRETCILNESYTDIPRKVAALCLYQQPFGFSREDARELMDASALILKYTADDHLCDVLESLAARIVALLPPEETP